MAKEESNFAKLLREAPMANNADTVTLVGILARTSDPDTFQLTLADGSTETLPVAAVKSAEALAGTIGQTAVQLELDAKQVPESIGKGRPEYAKYPPGDNFYSPPIVDYSVVKAERAHVDYSRLIPGPFGGGGTHPIADTQTFYLRDHKEPWQDISIPTVEVPPTMPGAEAITVPDWDSGGPYLGGNRGASAVPMIAALPHQASPATINALMYGQGLGYPYPIHPGYKGWDGTSPLYGQLDY